MLLGEPGQTQYDLRFQVAGIPVRVHPLFWLIGLIIGARSGDGVTMLVWIGVVFVSVLVHELGHAFVMRYYGHSPRVVLYMLGGLAIPDSSPWSIGAKSAARTPYSQIIISAAGPAAGFGLALLTCAFIYAAGGNVQLVQSLPIFWTFDPGDGLLANNYMAINLVWALLFVNIFWGLLNLVPVYPLDGGQIARELFVMNDPWKGIVNSLWLSVIAAGALALYGFRYGDWFIGLMFVSLAISSYQALQQFGGGGGYGGGWGGGRRPW